MINLPTLLMIERDTVERDRCRGFLADEYRVIEADNDEDALALCRTCAPECVLLDHRLPDVDGVALLCSLLGAAPPHTLAVVALTSVDDAATATQMLKSGAYDYLIKHDLTASKLKHTLRNALNDVALKRQLQEHRAALTSKNRQLERALQDMRDADRRKDEFVATLAHELRNPLAPIRNAVRILRTRDPMEPLLRWSHDVIERQVAQMARLLDDLLDISRITQGKLELRKQDVELSRVIDSAIETSGPLIDACEHQFVVHLPSQPVYLNADPLRLAQVFSNLLNNAAKYTDPRGHIELTASAGEDEILVSIKDDGIGIAPGMAPNLFDLFSQAAPASARAQGGIGIGLSLVRGLVELNGGRVDAYSPGPGKGSEFVVRLPRIATPRVSMLAPPVSRGSVCYPCRILVVDDSRDSADSLSVLLELMGHEVHTVYSGRDAVDSAANVGPDVILLDIGMPYVDGYDVARRIRRESWGKDIVLVALTGWGQEKNRRECERAGFDHHLAKPVDPDSVADILSRRKNQAPALLASN